MTAATEILTTRIVDPATTRPRQPVQYYVELLPLAVLKKDDTYQRKISEAQLKRMLAEGWNPLFAGAIVVSKRQDGSVFVVDGFHRVKVAQAAGEQQILCLVAAGLTLAEEAGLFGAMNLKKKMPSRRIAHKAARVAGDRRALAIDDEVHRAGFAISRTDDMRESAQHGWINAVDALQLIYDRYGSGAIYDTLVVVRESWPEGRTRVGALRRSFLVPLAHFVWAHGNEASMDRLAERLGAHTPRQIEDAARSTLSASPTMRTYHAIVEVYNYALRNRISYQDAVPVKGGGLKRIPSRINREQMP